METQTPQINQSDYERLRVEESWLNPAETQAEFLERYVGYTDNLIDAIEHFDEDESGNPIPADVVIYLDKSARPLAWMTREMWPMLANPNESGDTPEMPAMRFLNVDRLPWRINAGEEVTKHPDNLREPSKDDIDGLRAVFALPGKEADDSSPMDGKRVLVVDEVGDSGDTLYIAQSLLRSAFPGSQIQGFTWMNEHTIARDGSKRVLDRPVWYQANEESGRGVFGQQTANSPSANKKSTLTPGSHQFLSTRPNMPTITDEGDIVVRTVDERGRSLRNDIKRMAQALQEGGLMPRPHFNRESYNGLPIEEYAQRRKKELENRAAITEKRLR